MMADLVLFPIAAGVLAFALTPLARRYALKRSILDSPNHRSAHSVPTPRGGGLAIVLAVLGASAVAGAVGAVPWRLAAALSGGTLVAFVGWLDDAKGAGVRVRLTVHFLAAAWAMASLGAVTELRVGDSAIALGWAGPVLTMVAIVWAINLYNFMDGLDGFATMQGLTTGLVGATLLLVVGHAPLAVAAFILAGACAGFLRWNWPPATVFMGDVGSGFLGYCLGVLVLASDRAGAVPVIAWVVVLGAFLFDATVTVIRRLLRGDDVHEAHREHAYQRAAARFGSHTVVTVSLAVLNTLLGAIAWWGIAHRGAQRAAVTVAVVVLTVIYLVVEVQGRRVRTASTQPRA